MEEDFGRITVTKQNLNNLSQKLQPFLRQEHPTHTHTSAVSRTKGHSIFLPFNMALHGAQPQDAWYVPRIIILVIGL